MQTLRIFISSPGDVNEERDQARRVIDALQRHYTGVTLQAVMWEDLALPATASFQESIDVLLHQQPIDVAVFILWARLGSPLGAAVTRPDGSLYRSGTEREFDLMLAAFEQSGRKRPVILAYARQDEQGFQQGVLKHPVDRWQELVAQRELAKSFIQEQFHDANGRNLRAYHSYPEPVSFAQRLHTHLRGVLDELLAVDSAPTWLSAPYRGLEFFDVEHAPIFHGRDEETCELLQRLRDQEQAGRAFVVIVGASGAGKSSLARAGVAAALTQHAYDEQIKEWRAVAFLPSLFGDVLIANLIRRIARHLPELRGFASTPDDVANGLKKDPELTVKFAIKPAFTRASALAGGSVRILLVLDQMEELWTDRQISADGREQFLEILEALASSGQISILATLRSDFYPQAQLSPAFLRLKGERGHFDLVPPGPAALQRLIAEPARLAGLKFEHDANTGRTLDMLILEDAARDPASLPLLQFALDQLYQQREGSNRVLTFADYEKLGGVEGAIGQRAAAMYKTLPEESRASLPGLLALLVTVDLENGHSVARRRAPLSDLTSTPACRTLTDCLIAARFLTTDRQDQTPMASLAHEALLQRWDQIAVWTAQNQESLLLRARVERSRHRWEEEHRDASLLLPVGLPLNEGRQLIVNAPELISPELREYVAKSNSYGKMVEWRTQRLRWINRTVGLLATIFVGVSIFAYGFYLQAQIVIKARDDAVTQKEIAEYMKFEAEKKLKEALDASFAVKLAKVQAEELMRAALADRDKALAAKAAAEAERRAAGGEKDSGKQE